VSETWKPVVGHEGAYEVSDLGRVRSLDREWQQLSRHGTYYTHHKRGRMLQPGPMPGGHLSVAIGKGNSQCVHKLVLEAFVGPAPEGHEARHLNGIESDNRLGNLQWATRTRNGQDKKWHKGATTYKLSPDQVREIKRSLRYMKPAGLLTWLAEKFDVSPTTIADIRNGRTHTDVTL
jgi:hypothetical protein